MIYNKSLSVLCILMEVLSRTHAKGGKAFVISNLALFLVVFRHGRHGKHGSEIVKQVQRPFKVPMVSSQANGDRIPPPPPPPPPRGLEFPVPHLDFSTLPSVVYPAAKMWKQRGNTRARPEPALGLSVEFRVCYPMSPCPGLRNPQTTTTTRQLH